MEKKNEKLTVKEFFQLNDVLTYFFRKKKDGEKVDFSLRSMHFVNKLSMAIFLAAIVYLIIKHLL